MSRALVVIAVVAVAVIAVMAAYRIMVRPRTVDRPVPDHAARRLLAEAAQIFADLDRVDNVDDDLITEPTRKTLRAWMNRHSDYRRKIDGQ